MQTITQSVETGLMKRNDNGLISSEFGTTQKIADPEIKNNVTTFVNSNPKLSSSTQKVKPVVIIFREVKSLL